MSTLLNISHNGQGFFSPSTFSSEIQCHISEKSSVEERIRVITNIVLEAPECNATTRVTEANWLVSHL